MKCRLNKFLILFLLLFIFSSFEIKAKNNPQTKDNKSEKFFDIFSPDNLKGENNKNSTDKNNIDKINDFTLYAVINTDKLKEVLVKPKRITKDINKLRNKRGYITLHINDKIYKYQLIKIEKNLAYFKKGEKILKLSVFNEEKHDRIKVANKNNGPEVIAQPPVGGKNVKLISQKNNKANIKKPLLILNKKNKKGAVKKSNNNNTNKTKNNKKIKNPFLELIEKARKQEGGTSGTNTPNPFLQLLRHK